MGRLKPGWTIERANAQIQASLAGDHAGDPAGRITAPTTAKKYLANKLNVTPGGTGVSQLRAQYQDPLWILLATTGPGAADCLRESGESAAGARQRTGAGDRGAAGDWALRADG